MATGRSVKVLDEDTGEWVQYRITRVDGDVLELQDVAGAIRTISVHDPLLDWPDGAEAIFSSLSYTGNPTTSADSIPEVSRAVQQLEQLTSTETAQHSQQTAFIREFQLEDERQIVDQMSQDTFLPLDANKSSASGNAFAPMERSVGYDTSIGTLATLEANTLDVDQKRQRTVLAPPTDGSIQAPSNIYDDANASVPDGQGVSGHPPMTQGESRLLPAQEQGSSLDNGLDYSFHSHSYTSSPIRERVDERASESVDRVIRRQAGSARRAGRGAGQVVGEDSKGDGEASAGPSGSTTSVQEFHLEAPRPAEWNAGGHGYHEAGRTYGRQETTGRPPSHPSHLQHARNAGGVQSERNGFDDSQPASVYHEVLGLSEPYPADYREGFCRPAGAAEGIASLLLQSVHEGPVLPTSIPMAAMTADGMLGFLSGSALALYGTHSLLSPSGAAHTRVFVRVCVVQAGAQIMGTAANSRTTGSPSSKMDSARGKTRQVKVSAPGTRPVSHPLPDYSVRPDLRINPTTSRRMPIYRTEARDVDKYDSSAAVLFCAADDVDEVKMDGDARGSGPLPLPSRLQFACSLSTLPTSHEPIRGCQASLDWNFLRGYLLFQVFEERPAFEHATASQNVLLGHGLLRICDVFAACVRPHHALYSTVAQSGVVQEGAIQQEFYMRLWLPIQPCSGLGGPAGVGGGTQQARSGLGAGRTDRTRHGQAVEQSIADCSLQVELSLVLPVGILIPPESLRLDPALPPPIPGHALKKPEMNRNNAFVDARRSPSPERKQRSPGSASRASSTSRGWGGKTPSKSTSRARSPPARTTPAAASAQPQGQASVAQSSGWRDNRIGYMQLPAAAVYAPANGVFGARSPVSQSKPALLNGATLKTTAGPRGEPQVASTGQPTSPTSYRSSRSGPKRPGSASSRASTRASTVRAQPAMVAMAGGQQEALSARWTAGLTSAQGKEPPSSPLGARRPAGRASQPSPYSAHPGRLPQHVPFGPDRGRGQGLPMGRQPTGRDSYSSSISSQALESGPAAAPSAPHASRTGTAPSSLGKVKQQRAPARSEGKEEAEEAKYDDNGALQTNQAVLVRSDSAGSVFTTGSVAPTGAGPTSSGLGVMGTETIESVQTDEQKNELENVRARLEQLQAEMQRMQALLDQQHQPRQH